MPSKFKETHQAFSLFFMVDGTSAGGYILFHKEYTDILHTHWTLRTSATRRCLNFSKVYPLSSKIHVSHQDICFFVISYSLGSYSIISSIEWTIILGYQENQVISRLVIIGSNWFILVLLLTNVVHFDHLIKIVSASFFIVKFILSPFVIGKYFLRRYLGIM